MNNFQKMITNRYLYIPLILWFCIQTFKVIYELIKTKKFNFKRIVGAGGMPSSHSAIAMCIATMIGKAEGFDFFLYWVLVGCPYGIRKMCMILIPKNFGIAGSIGILALNCIVGGLIGGVVVILRMVMVLMEIIKIISDTSGHDVQRCR